MSLDANNYYKTKADLKRPVDAFKKYQKNAITLEDALKAGVTESDIENGGITLKYEETSYLTGPEYKSTGSVQMVGPDAYRKRSWYAHITLKDNFIVSVK